MSVILITGCSSGFGLGAAIALVRRGETVVAGVRDLAKAAPLRAAHGNLEVLALDVTDAQARRDAVEHVLARHGRIDVLINNAGIFSFGPAECLGEADLRTLFETNVFAAFGMMTAVLPGMRERRSGRIVNVTSVSAFGTPPFMSGYSASKHALDAMSSGMDFELKAFNIRVTSVAAAAFVTSIVRSRPDPATAYGEAPSRHFENFLQRMRSRPDPAPVIESIVEAATVPDPKRRYVVAPGDSGFDVLVAEKERVENTRRPPAVR
jgi:NAD(P)-dependent dehydrogenase (short-subunit alcohol dehydrogenase family)